jgi:CheY-like chemotaxis protein
MKKIIQWVINREKRAAECYEKAAALFSKDKEFAGFLSCLAEDEKSHGEIMSEASEFVIDNPPSLIISIDDAARQLIDRPFADFEKVVAEGRLTKQALLDCIISIEFSEWNDVFLYMINSVRDCSPDFFPPAADMEQHKRRIERFLESDPELGGFLERIRRLPGVLEDRVLLVADSKTTVDLFTAILKDKAMVDGAAGGQEALAKMGADSFTAVITDVRVPVISGIEFYKKAVEAYPNINEQVLFFTADDDAEQIAFFRENNLKYLIKPVPIRVIRKEVADILKRAA